MKYLYRIISYILSYILILFIFQTTRCHIPEDSSLVTIEPRISRKMIFLS